MSNNITLSVIVPVYNTADYLKRCMDSVVCQNIKDLEIIVIDDNSTDDSAIVISEYLTKYPNIQYIKLNKNKGVANARNIGIEKATGEFITFIDSDDWLDINVYCNMLKELERSSGDIAICGIKTEYESIHSSSFRYMYPSVTQLTNDCALRILSNSIDMGIGISAIINNKIFKTDLIKRNEISFPFGSLNEDDYFTFISLLHSNTVVLVPNIYYHYYQRHNSITHSFGKKHIESLFNTFEQLKNYLFTKALYEKFRKEYLAFFEKCLTFYLSIIINIEQDHIIQKKYIAYIFEYGNNAFTMGELLEFLDIQRLKKYFNI